uniref:THAP-type domain-containing protein n=1 Tax=Onchocerca volvulus TaxID=6282 RepID=A0A8R1XVS4_ONCVO
MDQIVKEAKALKWGCFERVAGRAATFSACLMPTTCGFPNCKFRSRYRGQEDNRHFYRIPKRPQVLRQRWLLAIGRTEDTVVSQAILYRTSGYPLSNSTCEFLLSLLRSAGYTASTAYSFLRYVFFIHAAS